MLKLKNVLLGVVQEISYIALLAVILLIITKVV